MRINRTLLGNLIYFCFCCLVLLGISACALSKSSLGAGGSANNLSKALLAEESARLTVDERGVPKISSAYYSFLLGEAALFDEDFDAALKYFEKAAEEEDSPAPFLRRRVAQLYVRAGKLDKALEQVERALKDNSNELSLLRLKAGILSARQEPDEAILVYNRIIELEPDNQDAYVLLSSLYEQHGRPKESIAVLKKLIEVMPKSLFGHYYVARMLESHNDFSGAETYYAKAIELNPNSESVRLDLARVIALQGDINRAIEICKEVLSGNSDSIRARKLLGQLLWEDQKLDEALNELEELRDMVSDPTETRLKIALIKLERKDYTGAQAELDLIIAVHPDHPTARYFLASAYTGLGQVKDALSVLEGVKPGMTMFAESKTLQSYLLRQDQQLERAEEVMLEALEVKTDDVNLLLYLASIQRERGAHDEAIQTTMKVIKLQPAVDQHYFTLGVIYDENQRKKQAMDAMRKAIELNPQNADALNYLGYTLAELGKSLEEAEQLVKRAILLDNDNGYYIDSLGWIYFKMGRFEEAVQELDRAVELTPNDSVILEHSAEAQLRVGEMKKALAIYLRALEYVEESEDEGVEDRLMKRIEELKGQGVVLDGEAGASSLNKTKVPETLLPEKKAKEGRGS